MSVIPQYNCFLFVVVFFLLLRYLKLASLIRHALEINSLNRLTEILPAYTVVSRVENNFFFICYKIAQFKTNVAQSF